MISKRLFYLILLHFLITGAVHAQDGEIEREYRQFVDEFIKSIETKKEVPVHIRGKLQMVFATKAKQNKYNDWGTAVKQTLQLVWPDTAVFAHIYNLDIKREAAKLSAVERINLIKVHHVSKNAFISLNRLIDEKGFQQGLIEYTYASYPKIRDSLLLRITGSYDSKIEEALLRDGSLMRSNQFAIALKFKTQIELPATVVDSLVRHALYLARLEDSVLMKDPFASVDFHDYEAAHLGRLLTEDQYTRVLSIQNKNKAMTDASQDWAEISRRGLAPAFDETKIKSQLFNYYLANWNSYYRNADDVMKRDIVLASLRQNQPRILKELNTVRNQAKTANSTDIKPKW